MSVCVDKNSTLRERVTFYGYLLGYAGDIFTDFRLTEIVHSEALRNKGLGVILRAAVGVSPELWADPSAVKVAVNRATSRAYPPNAIRLHGIDAVNPFTVPRDEGAEKMYPLEITTSFAAKVVLGSGKCENCGEIHKGFDTQALNMPLPTPARFGGKLPGLATRLAIRPADSGYGSFAVTESKKEAGRRKYDFDVLTYIKLPLDEKRAAVATLEKALPDMPQDMRPDMEDVVRTMRALAFD